MPSGGGRQILLAAIPEDNDWGDVARERGVLRWSSRSSISSPLSPELLPSPIQAKEQRSMPDPGPVIAVNCLDLVRPISGPPERPIGLLAARVIPLTNAVHHSANVGFMLGQRRRRWTSIKPALAKLSQLQPTTDDDWLSFSNDSITLPRGASGSRYPFLKTLSPKIESANRLF